MATILQSGWRVIRDSGHSPARIGVGLAWRVGERAFSIAPYFLAWLWLSRLLTAQAGAPDWLTAGACLLALLLAQMLCSYLSQMNSFLGSYALTIAYRARLVDHVRRLPLGVLGRKHIGHFASVMTDDMKRMEDVFTHLVSELLAALSVPLLFALVLVWIDWRLTLALLLTLPIAIAIINGANRAFLASGTRKQNQFHEVSGLIVEFISGLCTLRLFNRAPSWLRMLDQRFALIRDQSMDVEAWGAGSVQAYRIVLESGMLLLLATAGWLVAHAALTPVTWLAFVLTAYKILDPLLDAAAYLVELRSMMLGETRLRTILDEPELEEGARTQAPARHDIAYHAVSFGYEAEPVLHDVSFEVPERGVTAIVGPSGAGKSTLLELLVRFHDPRQGSITLGGVDLRQWQSDALYAQFGFVFQDVQLFDGSVLDNVRIGRHGASDEAVIAACRAACCDGFVQRLPHGYATRIGENGLQLSGGERQRLSIARALLKDAPILLLDEATAMVDPQSQHDIQTAMSRLIAGRTVIIVAHRLSTIRQADQILVLDRGRVCERGRHDALIAMNGLYAALWREQAGTEPATP